MPKRRQTSSVLGLALFGAVLFGTGGCSTHPYAPGARAGSGEHSGPSTVIVARASIVSTVVIPATVQAGVGIVVTAAGAGTYTPTQSGYSYRLDSGQRGELTLPAGVRLVRQLVRAGEHVPANYPLAQARVSGFALVAPLDAATTYKLYQPPVAVRGQIQQGPGPFACPLADRVPGSSTLTGDGQPAAMWLTCVVPADLTVFAGMPAVMAVTTAVATNVLVLPVEAIAGTSQRGRVWLADASGKRQLRDVGLGITDGAQIEITSGLSEGDVVTVPGPDLADRG